MSAPAASPLLDALRRLADGGHLDRDLAHAAFAELMAGEAPPSRIAALLMGLRVKGETPAELAGAILALRGAMRRVPHGDPDALVDTCGTGGGAVGTLNISTAAAFVAAAAGAPVAKHGNRSFTSRSGSADVLEALGVDIALEPERAAEVLAAAGIVFLFAPTYHPAMRHVGPVRRELAVPTLMNLVGPLANPAGVRRQVVGVADARRAELMAGALADVGVIHALVVHGEAGLDEISPMGPTAVWEVRERRVDRWTLDPEGFGLAHHDLDALAGGDPADNARRIEEVLGGGGHAAERAAIALNAAAALYVAGRPSIAVAVDEAVALLEEGRAAGALDALRRAAPRPPA